MSNTAWWAHVGGMGAGALLIVFLRPAHVLLFECVRPHPAIAAPRLDDGPR
jgi:hypothetical protein